MNYWAKICLTGSLIFLFLCLPATYFGRSVTLILFTVCIGLLITFIIIMIWDIPENK